MVIRGASKKSEQKHFKHYEKFARAMKYGMKKPKQSTIIFEKCSYCGRSIIGEHPQLEGQRVPPNGSECPFRNV